MAKRTVTALCTIPEEDPVPLFVGREDGTVDYYKLSDITRGGTPIVTFYGHTKTVTAIVAPALDQVFTCAMDGNIRQWSVDPEQETPQRCLKLIKIVVPLRCLAMCGDRLYAGDDNGCLQVISGERRSALPGHKDVLSCIACASEEAQIIVTGGYDNQIRVWDGRTGKTVRVLIGHTNHVKCLRVVAEGQLLFSFSRDLTMKIWRLPDPSEMDQNEALYISGILNRQATVSFKEPGADEDENDLESQGELAEGALSHSENVAPQTDGLVRSGSLSVSNSQAAEGNKSSLKSALKGRPEPPIQRVDAVGTVEIPITPHTVAARREEAAFCFVGASEGYVLGIDVRALSKTVLQFLSRNSSCVRMDTREMRQTLLIAKRVIFRRCRKAVAQKKKELVKAARKARAAKRAEERKERAAARAAARAERKARAAEEDEEDEEEDEMEEGDDEFAEEEELEDEEEQSEEDDPLELLDEQQKKELSEFTQEREKERNAELADLREAVEKRSEAMKSVSTATYDTPRDKFFRLSFTSYKVIGDEPVLAMAIAPGPAAFAVQMDRVIPVDITPGITYL